LQESAKNLAGSYQRWFKWLKTRKGKRTGAPRFKSRKASRKSFSYKSGIKVDGDRVWLPKIGWVRFRNSRDPIGKLKGATVSQNARGKWFVSIVAERPIARKPKRTEVVGVDVGLSTFATLSTGEKIKNPRWFRRGERKLARLQRSLARKKKGSANRSKAKQKVAIHHERVANRRKDFQHKQSTKLINENQVVSVESLSVAGLMRTRLAKSFSDAGLGEFLRQLNYKAEWYGRTLVEADRFFPSTKLCNCCGHKNDELSLSDREWDCPGCSASHDRDVNAAINLRNLAVGHTDNQNASGAAVSLASAS
jgi:putative transposase